MKILITGTVGLAKALSDCFSDEHEITMVSRSTGHNIRDVAQWGSDFLDYDIVFNNAHDEFYQIDVLNFFYNRWKDDPNKKIITIGSRCITRGEIKLQLYWPYQIQKQKLQDAHDILTHRNANIDIKIINVGAIDTPRLTLEKESKFTTQELAELIKTIMFIRTINRVDLNKDSNVK